MGGAQKKPCRGLQVLGPQGSWESWRECLELILKLNLEEGDQLAVELVSKQLIDRAWRIGDISLVKQLGVTLERVYKMTGRLEEAAVLVSGRPVSPSLILPQRSLITLRQCFQMKPFLRVIK